MKLIYKYHIFRCNRQHIELPLDFEILHFNHQDEKMFIWVSIDEDSPVSNVGFTIIGTGHEVPDGKYVGTVVLPEGYVWHLYQDNE